MRATGFRVYFVAAMLALAASKACPGQEPAPAQPPAVAPLLFPDPSPAPETNPDPPKAVASVRVSLRLEDNQRFSGAAVVWLTRGEGEESRNAPTGADGEAFFKDVPAGEYRVEAAGPGYVSEELKTEVDAGLRERMVYLVMKPKPGTKKVEAKPEEKATVKAEGKKAATPTAMPAGGNAFVAAPPAMEGMREDFRLFHESEVSSMSKDPEVKCPTEKVLKGTGERMKEFVNNLERFTATEVVEHYPVDVGNQNKKPETRQFAYVVTVSQNRLGTFLLDEYRDGNTDPAKFPAGVASNGLPALALLFHPVIAEDFRFVCEGLGQRNGKAAWQMQFAQRADRRVRIRSYKVGDKTVLVMLQGRAWIDPDSYQVMALESELQKPIPEIRLDRERIAIEYTPVEFRAQSEEIWLPREAEIYVDRNGHPYYRRHTFSDFKVFNVETAQNLQAPKGSYTFENHSDTDIVGVLTVTPEEWTKRGPVSLQVVVPARGKVFKVVGVGKDVNLPAGEVASAKFEHEGTAESVTVQANLLQETMLDVVPDIVMEKKR